MVKEKPSLEVRIKHARSIAKGFVRSQYILFDHDVDDFAQEAILTSLEGRWMQYGIIDYHRKNSPWSRKLKLFPEIINVNDVNLSYENIIEEGVLIGQIYNKIISAKNISSRVKETLIEVFFEGHTQVELSKIHNCTEGAISDLKKRGIRQLKQLFGQV